MSLSKLRNRYSEKKKELSFGFIWISRVRIYWNICTRWCLYLFQNCYHWFVQKTSTKILRFRYWQLQPKMKPFHFRKIIFKWLPLCYTSEHLQQWFCLKFNLLLQFRDQWILHLRHQSFTFTSAVRKLILHWMHSACNKFHGINSWVTGVLLTWSFLFLKKANSWLPYFAHVCMMLWLLVLEDVSAWKYYCHNNESCN